MWGHHRRSLTAFAPRIAVGLALAAAALACGGGEGGKKTPTAPSGGVELTLTVPTAPAPQPTPTPTPGSEPDESPAPARPGGGSSSGSCGEPLPPPLASITVRMHGHNGERAVLDSTPIVGPDAAYCKRIGFTDGRPTCPVRVEGHPERQACEALRVGRATDTGRAGPTWSANGKRCNGYDGGPSCMNHPDNQYLAFAWGPGRFRACAVNGVCGETTVP